MKRVVTEDNLGSKSNLENKRFIEKLERLGLDVFEFEIKIEVFAETHTIKVKDIFFLCSA